METEMNRPLQSELRDRAPGHVVGIEDCERTDYSLRVKYLTDYCPGLLLLRIADEYWLATQIMQRRRLIDIARSCTSPVSVRQLVEEFPPASPGCRDSEHPEILVGLSKLSRRN